MRRERPATKYRPTEEAYFAKRRLKKRQRTLPLWALGVGAVMAGHFFYWDQGLAVGGFGGVIIAFAILSCAFVIFACSVAEMAAALPHAGGSYSYGRTAMGPWGGLLAGLASNLQYIFMAAAFVVGIGGYMQTLFVEIFSLLLPAAVWWLIVWALFIGLNVIGVRQTFQLAVVLTSLSLGILLIFWTSAFFRFSWENVYDISPQQGGSFFLPFGEIGILAALPFALWFYVAMEHIAMAGEDVTISHRSVPKGISLAVTTVLIISLPTIFLAAGIEAETASLSKDEELFFVGLETIFPHLLTTPFRILIAVIVLATSLHCIIYGYSRNIYALGRAGYFPNWLALTDSNGRTPYAALIAGAALGYGVSLLIQHEISPAGYFEILWILLRTSLLAALLSYILQLLSFILMRYYQTYVTRPYISPFGYIGAYMALFLFAGIFVFLLTDRDSLSGIQFSALWFILWMAYFFLYARHRMVLTPEEDFALRHPMD